MNEPIITNDTVVFGLLTLCLGFIFYTSSIKTGFWSKFYNIVPAVLMCYVLPSILASSGLISDETSSLYFMASRYLLPAALILMTLSIDLKAIANLGSKALIMFLTGSFGIIIGGPLAILIISIFSPETVGGNDFDAIWRGLATIAGSWIGGGANQAAMLEIYQYNPDKYGGMVLVDIVVANVWMAIILLGVGKTKKIDRWLKADTSAIEELRIKVSKFTEKITRVPTLKDYMMMLFFAFTGVGISHFFGDFISSFLTNTYESVSDNKSFLSFLGSSFFWMVVLATVVGIVLSFTKAKNYEGAGASKLGSVFIYILVATIGMKMDLGKVFENPGLIAIGFVWITIHAVLLIVVAKLIKAPYFFLAVGSQANVGGAASAPVVAAEFHPSLTSVGVLLAVFGYVVGTGGAILCTILMEIASKV
ncbi:putative membrane protein [Arenibacter algicola]|uniref:Membrane protein n=1 Tax=Arenibacter algicola TaxID=616991 RepID=A0ABY3A5E4_9FLAO